MKNFNINELDSIISEEEISIYEFSRDELLGMISKMILRISDVESSPDFAKMVIFTLEFQDPVQH